MEVTSASGIKKPVTSGSGIKKPVTSAAGIKPGGRDPIWIEPGGGGGAEIVGWERTGTVGDDTDDGDAGQAGQVVTVAGHRQIRFGGPGTDDEAGHMQAAGPDRVDGQFGVIEGAQTGLHDHHHLGVDGGGDVQQSEVLGEADEYPTRPLDQGEVVVGGQFGHGADDSRQGDRFCAGPSGGGLRRERFGVSGAFGGGDRPGQTLDDGQVARLAGQDSGLYRFAHGDVIEDRGQRGSGDGLADIGGRSGDSDDPSGHRICAPTSRNAASTTSPT